MSPLALLFHRVREPGSKAESDGNLMQVVLERFIPYYRRISLEFPVSYLNDRRLLAILKELVFVLGNDSSSAWVRLRPSHKSSGDSPVVVGFEDQNHGTLSFTENTRCKLMAISVSSSMPYMLHPGLSLLIARKHASSA